MLEYRPSPTNQEYLESRSTTPVQNDGKLSLTKLWEVIVRTKRLPDEISETYLYDIVCEKLRDPEREVRQHALRVLMDLIPVTQPTNLDHQFQNILPDILKILDHSSPSLRKSALDSLKKYLKFSKNDNHLIKELLGSSDNFATVAPFLINNETDDRTVKLVVEQLLKDLDNPNLSQEDVAKGLARLRYNIGDGRFRHFIGIKKYNYLQEICEIYGLPLDYSDNEKIWIGEDLMEDKVILETEITLKTGPAITMKIHEESRPNSVLGVIKVLEEDSESDFDETVKRTPRKVRFGGESVKLRTPESDSSNPDESKNTLRITVPDAISISTKKSLIPVRITSLPSTPMRSSKTVSKQRLYQSAPNLAKNYTKTRIPFRRESNLVEKLKINEHNVKPVTTIKSISTEQLSVSKLHTTSRTSSPCVSPEPPHKSIEVFHNLTRSPVRQRRPSTVDVTSFKEKTINDKENISFILHPTTYSEDAVAIKDHKDKNIKLRPSTSSKVAVAMLETNKDYDTKAINNSIDYKNNALKLYSSTSSKDSVITNETNDDYDKSFKEINNINDHKNNSFKLCPSSSSKDSITTNELYDSFKVYELNSATNNNNDMESSTEIIDTSTNTNIQTNLEIKIEKKNDYGSFKVCSSDTGYSNAETSQDENLVNGTKNGGFDLNKEWQISSLSSDENLWNKSEALDNLVKMLKQPNTCETLEPGPAALLFEALFACQHLDKLHFLADDALALMIRGVRPEVLDQCLGRLSLGLCKIGAPSGIYLALLVMKKCQPKRLLNEVMDRCFAHKTREGALQLLMASARLLPRNELEVLKMTEFASATLRDRRRRVRHAALETLATLAQLSSNTEMMEVVERVTKACPDHEYLLRVVRTR